MYKGGHTYQHLTNKGLVGNAKGQKRKWLRELESTVGVPVECAAENDQPQSIRRTA
jgi:hypothetical protein